MPGWVIEVEGADGALLYAAYVSDMLEAEELVRATLKIGLEREVRAIAEIADDGLRDLKVEPGKIKGPM